MQIRKNLKSFVSSDKDIRKGIPVFKGTRVPVYTVLDHLAVGWTFSELKEAFPSVKSEYITKIIKTYSKDFADRYGEAQ